MHEVRDKQHVLYRQKHAMPRIYCEKSVAFDICVMALYEQLTAQTMNDSSQATLSKWGSSLFTI